MTEMTDIFATDCAELTLGSGAALFEVFLEPTCPFSCLAFGKLPALIDTLGEGGVTIRITLISQPWHLFSPVVTRAVLAAALLPEGRDKAMQVLAAVAAHREEFVAEAHNRGPNMDRSPAATLARVEEISGLSLKAAFETDAVTKAVKRHTRYARQNGIHSSPTFMVNGLVNDKLGSRDEVASWAAAVTAG